MGPFRTLLVASCLALLSNESQAQSAATYKVIKSGGQVFLAVSRRPIRTGDLLKTTDKVTFGTRQSYLHVVNASGRKTIRNVPDNSPRQMQQLLESYLSPDKTISASRGLGLEGIEQVKSALAHDTLLILGEGKIEIDPSGKMLMKPAGVKASYSINEVKTDKLISDNTGFSLAREALFASEAPAFPQVSVVYMEDVAEPVFAAVIQLGSFVPLYSDDEALQKEVLTIVESTKAAKKSPEVEEEVAHYLAQEYAPAIHQNLRDWLKSKSLVK